MHGILAAALLLTQAAPVAQPLCITPEEAGAMAVTLLPAMVDSVARRCQPQLGANAFLGQAAADEWSARLRREAEPLRGLALQGIGKFGGSEAFPAGMDPDLTISFMSEMVATLLANDLPTDSCADLDAIARSIAPLPGRNLAELVGATARLVAANQARDGTATEPVEAADTTSEVEPRRDRPSICQS